jgi:hypothetical protein
MEPRAPESLRTDRGGPETPEKLMRPSNLPPWNATCFSIRRARASPTP